MANNARNNVLICERMNKGRFMRGRAGSAMEEAGVRDTFRRQFIARGIWRGKKRNGALLSGNPIWRQFL